MISCGVEISIARVVGEMVWVLSLSLFFLFFYFSIFLFFFFSVFLCFFFFFHTMNSLFNVQEHAYSTSYGVKKSLNPTTAHFISS